MELVILTVFSTVYLTIEIMVRFVLELALLPFKLPLSGLCLWLSALRWVLHRLPLIGDYLFDTTKQPAMSRSQSLENLWSEKRDFRKRAHSFCNCDVTGKRSTRQKKLSLVRQMLVDNQLKAHSDTDHVLFPEAHKSASSSAGSTPRMRRRSMRHSMQEGLSGNTTPRLTVPKDPQNDHPKLPDTDPKSGEWLVPVPKWTISPPTSDTESEADPYRAGRIARHSSPDIYRFNSKSGEISQKEWKETTNALRMSPIPMIMDETTTEQLEEDKIILQLRLAEAERKNEALEEALLEERYTRSMECALPGLNDSLQKVLDDNLCAEENLRLSAYTEYEMATWSW